MSKTHGPRDVGGLRKSLLGDYIMPYWLTDTIVALYFVASIAMFAVLGGELVEGRTALWLVLGWAAWGGAMKLADWI